MVKSNKTRLRGIAIILVVSLLTSMVAVAFSDITWPEQLVGFERVNPVYSTSVEVGTEMSALGLPETLRAIVSIPDDMDVTTFVQSEPTADNTTGDVLYDYYQYGYVADPAAAEKYAAGELVIYQIQYADQGTTSVGQVGYRLYGSIAGSTNLWFVCNKQGEINGAVLDVPVVWSDNYDGTVETKYTLEATVAPSSTYQYAGTAPTADIYVGDMSQYAEADDAAVDDMTLLADESMMVANLALSAPVQDYNTKFAAYMAENIPISGNSDRKWSDDIFLTGAWVDYLNTLWKNRVTGVNWTPDSAIIGWWEGNAVKPWDGTTASQDGSGASSGQQFYPDHIGTTWQVWYGSQLLYAMENYSEGDTIRLMADINLNGDQYAWPGVNMTESVTIDGDGHTIYNLCSFTQQGEINGFATFKEGLADNDGVVEHFEIKNLNFSSGLMVAEVTKSNDAVALSLFQMPVYGGGTTFSITDVAVDNYVVCSTGSSVSVLIDLFQSGRSSSQSAIDCNNSITNCAVTDCYVYGNDHIGSFGTFTSDVAFSHCYATDNTLVGYGYHSGAFVSCLNNHATFDSCFSANNYMYSAVHVGGFVGYAGDGADYTNCYSSGKVEGFTFVGGFAGSATAGHQMASDREYAQYYSRNYCTFSNCYSTCLVGIRTETSRSGGFIGRIAYEANNFPKGSTLFTNCYAAGEVGNTSTDLLTNDKAVGGFVGVDATLNQNVGASLYTNCYYDKQTTAMCEWVMGDYSTSTEPEKYDVGITGTLTTTTEKGGVGLTDQPGVGKGFVGFTENWSGLQAVVDEQSDAYTNGESSYLDARVDWGTVNSVRWVYQDEYYPQLSVFFSPSAADWGSLDTDLVEAFSQASVTTVLLDTWDSGYDWTYGIRTDEVKSYDRPNLGDHKGDEYTYDTVRTIVSDATVSDGTFRQIVPGGIKIGETGSTEPIEGAALYIDNEESTLDVKNSGLDWYAIQQRVNGVTGERPIRLVTFMNVYAGADTTVPDNELYDHRVDVSLTMMDELKDNLVLNMHNDQIWATVQTMGFPGEHPDYCNNDTNFYEARTNETGFYSSEDAWLNTEIWVAQPYDEATYDGNGNLYYTQDNSETYVEGLAVKLAGEPLDPTTDTPLTIAQQQWTGSLSLATDNVEEEQVYIVAYYWLLADGRYRTDYKIVKVEPQDPYYNVAIQVFDYLEGAQDEEATSSPNDAAMELAAGQGGTVAALSSTTLAKAEEPSVPAKTTTHVAWSQYDPAYRVEQTELIMTNHAGLEVGHVLLPGDLEVGDTITIPVTTYYTTTGTGEYEYIYSDESYGNEQDETVEYHYQDTHKYTAERDHVYTVAQDEVTGGLYLAFASDITYWVDEAGNVTNVPPAQEVIDEYLEICLNDISYNITFNLYVVEVAQVTVAKVIEGLDANAQDYNPAIYDQSFLFNLGRDYNAQIALNHGETSKPIVTVMPKGTSRVLSVRETMPMEFQLADISYVVENYTMENGENVYTKTEYLDVTGDEVVVNPGDIVTITVTNSYSEDGYFKDRSEIYNIFNGIPIAQ